MIFLFIIFFIVFILIYLRKRQWAIYLSLINIVLCLVMFIHHVTTPINIQL